MIEEFNVIYKESGWTLEYIKNVVDYSGLGGLFQLLLGKATLMLLEHEVITCRLGNKFFATRATAWHI